MDAQGNSLDAWGCSVGVKCRVVRSEQYVVRFRRACGVGRLPDDQQVHGHPLRRVRHHVCGGVVRWWGDGVVGVGVGSRYALASSNS